MGASENQERADQLEERLIDFAVRGFISRHDFRRHLLEDMLRDKFCGVERLRLQTIARRGQLKVTRTLSTN